jgi:hypothetical protein
MSKSKGGGTGRGTDSKGWTRWKGKNKGKPAVKDNSKILGAKGIGAVGEKGANSGGLKWTESGKNGSGNKTKSGIESGKNGSENKTKSGTESGKNEDNGTKTESGSVTKTAKD